MSMKHLGETFDIHGGGKDLVFPHHENEIAQSEAATGKPFARYWLHNGFVNVNNEKMSKSLGNFFTLRDVLAQVKPEVLRFFLASSHYRSPIDYSDQSLTEAKAGLDRLYRVKEKAEACRAAGAAPSSVPAGEEVAPLLNATRAVRRGDGRRLQHRRGAGAPLRRGPRAEPARTGGSVDGAGAGGDVPRGVRAARPVVRRPRAAAGAFRGAFPGRRAIAGRMGEGEILAGIEARRAARAAKQYAEADRIRKDLEAAGVLLEDGKAGTTWKYKE